MVEYLIKFVVIINRRWVIFLGIYVIFISFILDIWCDSFRLFFWGGYMMILPWLHLLLQRLPRKKTKKYDKQNIWLQSIQYKNKAWITVPYSFLLSCFFFILPHNGGGEGGGASSCQTNCYDGFFLMWCNFKLECVLCRPTGSTPFRVHERGLIT